MYQCLIQGHTPDLGKVHPYSDYIKWLRHTDKAATLAYWREYLSGYDALSGLPAVSATGKPAYKAKQSNFSIDGALRQSVRTLCAESGITENIFIQTVWSVLLGRYNNTNDVVFGAVVSGRPAQLEGVEDMIGLFINTIPVRITFGEGATIREVMKQVHQNYIAGLNHHYAQLADIHGITLPGRNLFDHIVVFENYPVQEMVKESVENNRQQKPLTMLSSGSFEQSNYDFMFTIVPGENLLLKFSYNANVYSEAQVERVMQHLVHIIEQVVLHSAARIEDIDYLDAAEKEVLLDTFNDTAAAFRDTETLISLFEEQVTGTPETTALVFEGRSFTYREINEKANRLAHYLRITYAIVPGDRIGVKLDRSEQMIVALLGALKSGGAYVPIDPGYPQERIDYLLEDSQCKVLIDDALLAAFDGVAAGYSTVNPESVNTAADLAYVIYTSGSTGQPKGCMLEHRGVVNRIAWMWQHYGFSAADVVLQKTTFTFDVSVWEIFLPLCWGARMVLCHKDDVAVPGRLLDLIEREKVTCLHFVPSMFSAFITAVADEPRLPQRLLSLRGIMTSGEALPAETVAAWYQLLPVPVHNLYGPTEASVDVTYYTTAPGDTKVPIGRPIWNTAIYILDADNRLLPSGVAGEICIGGIGLSRGYLNKPQLTAEKFVANPFRAGERMYKTGDLGRWLPDGNIEYLGRKDDQVKIRGYRIELGEIEAALLKQPGVSAAAVTVKTSRDGDKDLLAYIVSNREYTVSELKTALGNTLPGYMVPAYYMPLASMPLSANGKLDRKKLPEPDGMGLSGSKAYVAPANELEEQLVHIWQDLLGREKVGVRDNFYEIGGNSIKIIRLSKILSKTLDKDISVALLFQYPNIADLVDYITQEPVICETADFDSNELAEDLDKFNFM